MRVRSRSFTAVRAASLAFSVLAAGTLLLGAGGGCYPTVYNTRPEVKGTVRDFAGAPIADATVRVTDPAQPDGASGAADQTDAQGRFKVPPSRKFGFHWLTAKEKRWTWKVAAEAPGHTPASVELSHRGQMPKNTFENVKFRLPAQ